MFLDFVLSELFARQRDIKQTKQKPHINKCVEVSTEQGSTITQNSEISCTSMRVVLRVYQLLCTDRAISAFIFRHKVAA